MAPAPRRRGEGIVERTLHRDFYFSDEIFQCGRDRIFHREWFCAGRVEELRQLGDYVAPNVAGESVLVVRTRDGVLSAHYNGCRHRGSRLVPEGSTGSFAGAIRCPYHSWTYSLDGQLRTAPFITPDDGDAAAGTDWTGGDPGSWRSSGCDRIGRAGTDDHHHLDWSGPDPG
jgi:phenylpropionate dioxygenase-like ring-hydroxylating dioxygenase large terminal subunit